jgi:exopolysaccharide biosynthesis polyprenyl glycosylphosphotransferase
MSYKPALLYSEDVNNNFSNIQVVNDVNLFLREIIKKKIQIIIISDETEMANVLPYDLFELLKNQVRFINISEFYENYLRRIPINAINELWLLKTIDLRSKNVYTIIKRIIDFIGGSILLLLTLPFWPLLIVIIKFESKGPAFFTQIRTGYLGEQFKMVKFRTMRIENNEYNPTVAADSRITKFGNFLRKTRIDEIPQLINIIKSEMSFIGPRPERPELIEELEKEVPFYRQRLLIKPGISGWDQVCGEYHSPTKEDSCKKLQYDLYYIKNMSLFLDLSIFFKTVVTVFKRVGV